jgi:hypothetical protein
MSPKHDAASEDNREWLSTHRLKHFMEALPPGPREVIRALPD